MPHKLYQQPISATGYCGAGELRTTSTPVGSYHTNSYVWLREGWSSRLDWILTSTHPYCSGQATQLSTYHGTVKWASAFGIGPARIFAAGCTHNRSTGWTKEVLLWTVVTSPPYLLHNIVMTTPPSAKTDPTPQKIFEFFRPEMAHSGAFLCIMRVIVSCEGHKRSNISQLPNLFIGTPRICNFIL